MFYLLFIFLYSFCCSWLRLAE